MSDRQAGLSLGFLTVQQDAAGFTGGYLVTNAWGRPLEFRLTTPVQPNRVQQILYGATLDDYLHADLIGKTLVEKTGTLPALIVTDEPKMLALRSRIGVPVIGVGAAPEARSIEHPRSSHPLALLAIHSADGTAIDEILNDLDAAIDLAEPFARIREALAEARAPGLSRAA